MPYQIENRPPDLREQMYFPEIFRGIGAVTRHFLRNLFFTRALWEAAGPFASFRYCHDWDFLVRAVAWTEPIFVARPLYRYRLHRQNSYKNLEGVAEAETQAVLGGYFSSVRTGAPRNPIAPSPAQWPGVFDHVMDRHGFWRHW
jgi:hypothetical protein